MPGRLVAAIPLVVLGFASAPLLTAQLSGPPALSVVQAAPLATFSDAELRSAAVAAVRVKLINDTYLPKLETAATVGERRQVAETASAKMEEAVKGEGMSVPRFREIITRAQADPELADRLREKLRQPLD